MIIRRSCYWLATVLIAAMATASALMAQSENKSLGEYARAATKARKASPPAARVYDNDNLPRDGAVSVVGQAGSELTGSPQPAEESSQQSHDQDQAQDKDKDKDKGKEQSQDTGAPRSATTSPSAKEAKASETKLEPGQSAQEREKALQGWKQKIAGQKEKIDLLSRELDVVKGEYRLKAAEFYANTGRRLENPYGFAADDAKYKQQIADKEKDLEDAKAKLADMQEEARHQGAPNSVTE
ncbi:MAG: hypothetical protein JOZ14_02805 [Acidobacteria bacterium]|nr:hypothetical protein [Acidobacteriota bacterium]